MRTKLKAIPRLERLEGRCVPAGAVSLVTRAEPSIVVDTAGGESFPVDNGGRLSDGRPGMSVSADGRFSVVVSTAANLVPGQTDINNEYDVFLYDRVTDEITLVSHAAGAPAQAGNGVSGAAVISADGRFVAFASEATDLVPGFVDGNAGRDKSSDVYLYDRVSGQVQLVSRSSASPTTSGGKASRAPVISADGRFVAYTTEATDIVPGYIPGPNDDWYDSTDVVLYDRMADTNALVSHSAKGPTHGCFVRFSTVVGISPDGRHVTFNSDSRDILSTENHVFNFQLYSYDRVTAVNQLFTGTSGATAGNANSHHAVASADGRFVAFLSAASNLVPGYVSGTGGQEFDVFLADRVTGTVTLVSHVAALPATGGNMGSRIAAISGDGRFVVYFSQAGDLVPGFVDGNGPNWQDSYVFDRLTGVNTLISGSAGLASVGGNGPSTASGISADGRYVTFDSTATDLLPGFSVGADSSKTSNVYVFDRLTQTITLVSHTAGKALTAGGGNSGFSDISADGSVVVFSSDATDLMSGVNDINRHWDLFCFDRAGGNLQLASRRQGAPSASAAGNLGPYSAPPEQAISDDGRFFVYASDGANVVPGQIDTNNQRDVFLYDRATKATTLVSRAVGTTAQTGNGGSAVPVISGDGRFVVYASRATNLVAGFVDGNGPGELSYDGTDVYVFDRLTGVNSLVSRSFGNPAVSGNGFSGAYYEYNSWFCSISHDGQYIAYVSSATDLVPGFVDANGQTRLDVYLFDQLTGVNTLVSRSAASPLTGGARESNWPIISDDGRYVVFVSIDGGHLTTGAAPVSRGMVYLFDRMTGSVALVSRVAGSAGAPSNAPSREPSLSADGRLIAYSSNATNLIAGSNGHVGLDNVFVFDVESGTTTLVSHATGSPLTYGDAFSGLGNISADGRFVTYHTRSENIVASYVDGNEGKFNVFLYDRESATNTLLSASTSGGNTGGNGVSWFPVISGDGRFVVFASAANDLVPNVIDENRGYDIILYDRIAGMRTVVSHTANDWMRAGNAGSGYGYISRDGTVVAFFSSADDLVAGDANGFRDIFAYSNLPTVQSVRIADGSPQRSVVRSLRVDFDQPVFFAGEPAAAFVLTSPAGSVQLAAGSVSGTSVTLTFSGSLTQFGSLMDGRYTLRVLADQISNIGPLDGNNDGVGGDDFTFNFHRLFGDADGNGFVDALDFRAFRAALGSAAFAFDFDGDGDVDAADFVAFRGRFGTSI